MRDLGDQPARATRDVEHAVGGSEPELGEGLLLKRREQARTPVRAGPAVEVNPSRLLGPDAVAKGADPMVIALFLIAVFDGLAVQFRIAPEDTPTGEQLVAALAAAAGAALEPDPAG